MAKKIDFYGLSDIGLVRKKNEDIFKILENNFIFSIADGMGGHKAGDIAAKEATNHLCNLLSKTITSEISLDQVIYHIDLAIKETNFRIYTLSKSNENFYGMGTTLCCLFLHSTIAIFAHIGDSRIYQYQNNNLIQLTKDHSLINKLKDQNKNYISSYHKNIITKAIGTHPTIAPSIGKISFVKNNVFLMCTDGLSDYIPNEVIKKFIEKDSNCKNICENLINEAKNNGSSDNITCIAIKILDI
jgi:PPM family protein phosphatase